MPGTGAGSGAVLRRELLPGPGGAVMRGGMLRAGYRGSGRLRGVTGRRIRGQGHCRYQGLFREGLRRPGAETCLTGAHIMSMARSGEARSSSFKSPLPGSSFSGKEKRTPYNSGVVFQFRRIG